MVMKTRSDWLLPTALIALCVIPVAAGVHRLAGLGGTIEPENARFLAAPVPTVIHILSANVFTVLGAFQFAPKFRRRRPDWHRMAGKILTVCGLLAGLSGLWMTLFFPRVAGDNELLYFFRLVFGVALPICMLKGYAAIRRRDITRHRAWMSRGYAIGIGAGTQALITIPWLVLGGSKGDLARALLLGAGWAINLALAEWSIRRGTTRTERASGNRLTPGPSP